MLALAVARIKVRNIAPNAYSTFVSTGNEGTHAFAVIRAEKSHRHPVLEISDRFVYEGPALGAEQMEAERKAWNDVVSRIG